MTESPGKLSPNGGSETSSGFKSFWKKSEKAASPNDVTFVQHDPSGKQSGNRLSRILKTKKGSPASNGSPEGDANVKDGKRRQQVYQAQKRHRNRRAEYVKSLEEEVAKLQHMDSVVNTEKNTLAYQNQMMRELLASHSLDFRLDNSLNLEPAPTPTSALGSASVEVRWDPEIGADRTFMDIDWSEFDKATSWTTTTPSHSEQTQPTPPSAEPKRSPVPVPGDSWAAVDFILALEHVCQGHMVHPHIHPTATPHDACKEFGLHGHALTGTASVYQSALPPSTGEDGDKWQLPHAEIDKLVRMSEDLPMDDEWITPAQAYSAIKEAVPEPKYLRLALEALKVPLAGHCQCQGFGAVMARNVFDEHLEATMQTLTNGESPKDL